MHAQQICTAHRTSLHIMPTPRMTRSRAARPAVAAAASSSPSPSPRAKSSAVRSRSAASGTRSATAAANAAAADPPSALATNESAKNVDTKSESGRADASLNARAAIASPRVISSASSPSPLASRPARSWFIAAALCALNALLAGSVPPGAYASTDSFATRVLLMAHVFLGVCALVASMPRHAQPLSYHNFVDQRALCCGVPNTLDVAVRLMLHSQLSDFICIV